jgi:hypothetical protein
MRNRRYGIKQNALPRLTNGAFCYTNCKTAVEQDFAAIGIITGRAAAAPGSFASNKINRMKIIMLSAAFVLGLLCARAQSISALEAGLYRTVPLPVQQTAAWQQLNAHQQDIAYLFALIEEAYPYWQQKIKPAAFGQYRAQLLRQFATDTSKLHLDLAVQQVLSRLKDAHCNSRLPFLLDAATALNKEFAFIPYLVKTDFYLRNVGRQADSNLIGAKIIKVNNRPMETVRQAVKAFESTESMEGSLFRFASQRFTSAFWLAQLGLAGNTDSITLQLQLPNGSEQMLTLYAQVPKSIQLYKVARRTPETARNAKGFYFTIDTARNLAFLQMNTMSDYEVIKSGIAQYVSPAMLPMALQYMKGQHQKAGTLNFNQFIINAMDSIRQSGVQNIVLDLRFNGGGDMRLPKQFLYLLDLPKPVQGFQTIKKLSPFYQYAMHEDFMEDSLRYKQRHNAVLPADGRMMNVDSVCQTADYKDFFNDVKQPGTPFYIDPAIPKFRGRLYVLTAFGTGSAAMITATTIADNHLGTIVGLPTGNQPTNATGSSNCKLPNSGIPFSLSYIVMRRPDAAKHGDVYLQPDVLIWRNMNVLNQGVDEHVEWVAKDIALRAGKK